MKGQVFILAALFIISLALTIPRPVRIYHTYVAPQPCLQQAFGNMSSFHPTNAITTNSTHVTFFGEGWAQVGSLWTRVDGVASVQSQLPASGYFGRPVPLRQNETWILCPGKPIYMKLK